MDTLSHGLWGGGLFGYRGRMGLALFFGVFPDLFSFGLWLPFYYRTYGFHWGPPPMERIPEWLLAVYPVSHSLVVAGVAVAAVSFWRKEVAFAMLGWVFHILLDAPFHTADYFPTPIFWPVSDWMLDGIAWSNPWVWFSNVAGLVVLFLWRGRAKLTAWWLRLRR